MPKDLSMSKIPAGAMRRSVQLLLALMFATPVLSVEVLAQTAPPAWRKDPASNCSFVAPASLGTGPIYWTGACPDGKASGAGMLRRRDGGRAGAAFYGNMDAGMPQLGVVDDAGGYRVGHFVNGDIGKRELEAQARLDSFHAAVAAARAVSAHFASVKNGASAEYYEDIAKMLELQIE